MFLSWFTGCWYHCFIYNVCRQTFTIKWAFGSISTIAPWLLEVGWTILRLWEAMTTQLYRIFIEDFWHFMIFREMVKSMMELFTKKFDNCNLLAVFAKRHILDVWQGSEYASGGRNLNFSKTDNVIPNVKDSRCKTCENTGFP